jgi:pilus assembly protein CpaE
VIDISVPAATQILIVGSDPKLRAELEAALSGSSDERPIIHQAADYRLGVEAARSRRPDLLLAEMTPDLRQLKMLSEEIALCSPDTLVAAVFHPNVFGAERSESGVLIEAIRFGIRDFLRRPLSRHDVEQLLARLDERRTQDPRAQGKIVAMMSNKGGVGKSTLAVNAACGLAERYPGQVLLVDLSLQMGVCASMLDLEPETSLMSAVRERNRLDETLIRQLAVPHESGLHLLAAPGNAVEGAEVDDEMVTRILMLARRAYDFVVVDTFPVVDRVVMAVLDLSDRVYIVLENVVPSLVNGRKLLELFDGLGCPSPRRRIVLNRYTTAGGSLKAADVAVQLGCDVHYVLPFDHKALLAANTGRPFVLTAGRFSRLGRAMRAVVKDLETVGQDVLRNGQARRHDTPAVAGRSA